VAGRDLGLHRVRSRRGIEPSGPVQRGQATPDQQPVPAPPVLAGQQDRLAARAGAGRDAGCLQLHQRNQAVYLDLTRQQARQYAADPQRLCAQLGTDPVAARGRGVAFVEDQVDDLKDGGEPACQRAGRGDLERYLPVGDGPLGADDSLRDRGLGDQERAADFVRGQASDKA
jgi:hypothetical protein